MNIPHTNNSFSYKTIHPTIRNILDERSKLDNTVQVSMPFVKATTTLELSSILEDGVGFTLGTHATKKDLTYQDMYASQTGRYLVGYTYQPPAPGREDGTNKLIYADPPPRLENILRVFDLGLDLHNSTEFSAVPPPGITRVSIGKRRSGLISVANINFSVPTLIQLEFLHKAFLIPGIGMILEWGQQFAPKKSDFTTGQTGLYGDIDDYMFPWYGINAQGDTKELLFDRLSKNQIGVEEILEKYSHPTQGQYQWMFGRISSFNVNSNPDGSYECMVRIVGPSEDSWAYSVMNTSVPAVTRGQDSVVCIDETNSVMSYFDKESGIDSFIGVIEATENGRIEALKQWQRFVKRFDKPSQRKGPRSTSTQSPAKDLEDAYFISWRYFVNVILNDETYGVKSIFKNANVLPEWLDKISLLRPYNNRNGPVTAPLPREPGGLRRPEQFGGPNLSQFEDPYENFVGANPYLRSTDLSTMVIVNEEAVKKALEDDQRKLRTTDIDVTEFLGEDDRAILDLGDFYRSAQNINIPGATSGNINDRGFLSTGVWINHKAIVQSFSTANTILDGIQNLLNRMSAATNGFWNLVVDVSEPMYQTVGGDIGRDEEGLVTGVISTAIGIEVYNYSVVDLNYTEHSEYAVSEFLNPTGENRVHTFNKYIRNKNGTLFGSELTDCKIDISLPKSMFSQIATMGIVHPEDAEIDAEEEIEPATVSNVHDTLRRMFSITSIARRPDGTSADRTALIIQRPETGGCSGQSPVVTTAGTLPDGIAGRPVSELKTRDEVDAELKRIRTRLSEADEFLEECNSKCGEAPVEDTPEVVEEPSAVFTVQQLPDIGVSQLTIGEIKERQRNRHLFAVGKYQFTTDTFSEAVNLLKNEVNDNTIYSEDVQERFGDYLLTEKPDRSRLARYLAGRDVQLFDAQLELAQEFASMPVPAGTNVKIDDLRIRDSQGRVISRVPRRLEVVFPTDSISYYAGDDAGNKSKVSAEEAARALLNARTSGRLGDLKEFIAQYESAEDGYDAANVIPRLGGQFITLRRNNDANYRRAVNNLPYVRINPRENFSVPVPEFEGKTTDEIQRLLTRARPIGPVTPANLASRRQRVEQTRGRLIVARQSLTQLERQLALLNNLASDPATTNQEQIRNSITTLQQRIAEQSAEVVNLSELYNQLVIELSQLEPLVQSEEEEEPFIFTATGECPLEAITDNILILSPVDGISRLDVSVFACNTVVRIRDDISTRLEQLELRRRELPRIDRLQNIRETFPHFRPLYRYLEPFPDYMVANIRKTADGNSSNAFGSAPGSLSIKANLEMPGINGLRLGQLFWVDRMPAFYKAYGAFIILGVEEQISPNGWTTKFDGTFYYLGNAWKNQMAKILSGQIEL
jgi:hypothetical protein